MKLKDKNVYLAGPMRGLPEYNFPAFHAAAADLRSKGAVVFSPAEKDEEDGFDPKTDEALPLAHYMQKDLPAVCASDVVACLPGWENSSGARLETLVAERCGIPCIRYPSLKPLRHPGSTRFHELLREAGELHDLKQGDYGSESDPFANVRASRDWGLPAWIGAMVRATDKVKRLQTFARKGALQNEAAVDSFMDLAVYSLIARVLYEEE